MGWESVQSNGRVARLAIALWAVVVACTDDSTAPLQAPIPTSVGVSVSSLSFSSLGETARLTATVHDQNGQAIAGAPVAWISAHPSVAIVDGNGLVSAVGNGATSITVTAGTTATASLAVTVEQVANSIVLSPPPDSVAVGDSIRMTAEVLDGLGNPIADVILEWSSSDTTVATVDQEGWVRAKAADSVVITIKLGELSTSTSLVILPDEERAALEAFYHATNGPEWKNNTNWLTDKPLGQWYGIATDASRKVVGLRFNKNRLKGPVPAELTHLTDLRTLSLWGDWEPGISLAGPIPPELAGLANLTELNLGNNELTGEIPPGLADLSNLTRLSLVQNRLTGRIPPELARLTNLQELSLGGNRLSGNIPAELGHLTGLTRLDLANTGLTGELPLELGNLVALRELWLGHNDLTGAIPAELGNLAELQILSLTDAGLSGSIPRELGGLAQLRDLSLSGNDLTGSIPPELGTHLPV